MRIISFPVQHVEHMKWDAYRQNIHNHVFIAWLRLLLLKHYKSRDDFACGPNQWKTYNVWSSFIGLGNTQNDPHNRTYMLLYMRTFQQQWTRLFCAACWEGLRPQALRLNLPSDTWYGGYVINVLSPPEKRYCRCIHQKETSYNTSHKAVYGPYWRSKQQLNIIFERNPNTESGVTKSEGVN